jgi:hypothetical protein
MRRYRVKARARLARKYFAAGHTAGRKGRQLADALAEFEQLQP